MTEVKMTPEKKYMVLFVDVKGGKVEGVYGSNKLGKCEYKAEEVKDPEKLPNFSNVEQIESITTLYAPFNPKCRYVRIGGKWYKICKK